MNIESYIEAHIEWSRRTFGPGARTMGLTRHIEQEIAEVRADPRDLLEWIDIVILAIDGFWRHGGDPDEFMRLLRLKQETNFARQFPRDNPEDFPSEHIRSGKP